MQRAAGILARSRCTSTPEALPRRLGSREEVLAAIGDKDLFLFAYGALMWADAQGVEVEARVPAVLRGYKRSLCVKSNVYRGSAEAPGLVLGLDARRGASALTDHPVPVVPPIAPFVAAARALAAVSALATQRRGPRLRAAPHAQPAPRGRPRGKHEPAHILHRSAADRAQLVAL